MFLKYVIILNNNFLCTYNSVRFKFSKYCICKLLIKEKYVSKIQIQKINNI